MSQIYGAAIQEGFGSLEILATGSNAKTRAAYDAAYSNEARRIAGRNRMSAAQKNLAAIQQDKILTNRNIQVQNTQAQAMTKLSAAVAGVTGNSVDDVKQQHNTAEAFAMQSNARQAAQQSDQFVAQIQGEAAGLLGVQDQKISPLGDLMSSFSKLDKDDWKGMAKAAGLFGG